MLSEGQIKPLLYLKIWHTVALSFLPKRIPGDFSFAADVVSVHFYMTSIGFSFLKRKKKTKQKKLLVSWEFLMSSGKFCWK